MENAKEFYNKSKLLNKPSGLIKGFFNMKFNQYLSGNIAIDIGAGVGNDAKFLIDNGFKVTCIDKEKKVEEIINNKIEKKENLKVIIDNFENTKLQKADLMYSCLSLQFCNPNKIDELMNNIIENIKPNGFFVR